MVSSARTYAISPPCSISQARTAARLARKAGIPLTDARRITGAVMGRGRRLRDARNVRREVMDRVDGPGHARRDLRGWRGWTPATASASTCSRCPTARGSRRCASRSTTPTTWSASPPRPAARMACAFCATGELGLTRSLGSLGDGGPAAPRARRLDPAHHRRGLHGPGRAVPQLRRGARTRPTRSATRPARASTRGASPSPPPASSRMIRRYTAEGHKFRLCISLNAAIPWKRAGAHAGRGAGLPARRAGGGHAGARARRAAGSRWST